MRAREAAAAVVRLATTRMARLLRRGIPEAQGTRDYKRNDYFLATQVFGTGGDLYSVAFMAVLVLMGLMKACPVLPPVFILGETTSPPPQAAAARCTC